MWKALRATRHGAATESKRRKLQKSASPTSPLQVKTGDIVEDGFVVVSRPARVSLAEGRVARESESETARRENNDECMTAEAAFAAALPESQPLAQPRRETCTTTTTTTATDDAVQDIATTTTEIAAALVLGDGERERDLAPSSLCPSPFPPALVRPDIPNFKTNSNSTSTSSSTYHSTSTSTPTLIPTSLSIFKSSPSTSTTSLSIYPPDEIHHMAFDILKRTRAKTPCFWVGQLDHPKQPYDDEHRKIDEDDGRYDSAIALACEYQAVLPPRSFTPASISDAQPLGRTIRKVKGRQSLRDIVEREEEESESVYSSGSGSNYGYGYSDSHTSYSHYNHVHHTSINIHNHYNHNHNYNQISYPSDSDTLVGSDSPSSPLTPSSSSFSSRRTSKSSPPPMITILPPIPPPHDPSSIKAVSLTQIQTQTHTSPAFQLCLDLLTAQLAQGLFKKHPAEPLDRASGLQIRLMIEAYESVLDQLRENAGDYDDGLGNKSTEDMQHTLDHWIAALYSVYERTTHDDVCSVDSWTSCRSQFSAVGIECRE